MAKRSRICLYCFQAGITVTFDTGNQLRKHVKIRHPQTKQQKQRDRRVLKEYRREALIKMQRAVRRD